MEESLIQQDHFQTCPHLSEILTPYQQDGAVSCDVMSTLGILALIRPLLILSLYLVLQISPKILVSTIKRIIKQVAKRATIAHLTASHQNILNGALESKIFLKLVKGITPWSKAGSSQISNSFETI